MTNDEREILEKHSLYLRQANQYLDVTTLRSIWSADPSNQYFNGFGHNYQGLEHWARLWEYLQGRLVISAPWEAHDRQHWIDGDVALVTCQRTGRIGWSHDDPDPIDQIIGRFDHSRSTEIYCREADGEWRVVHAHFSPSADQPLPPME